MSSKAKLGRGPILTIGILCGIAAAIFQGWWLYNWLGPTFWFFVLVLPSCMVAMQMVASTVAVTLHKQFGDPEEELFPGLSKLGR